jgi:site-specific recombinase XerD
MELNKLSLEFFNSYSNYHTKRSYKFAVRLYLRWLELRGISKISHLSINHFNDFSTYLMGSKRRLITIKIKLHVILSFYRYLYQMDYLEERFLKRLAIPKKAPIRKTPGLTDVEAKKFLNCDYPSYTKDLKLSRDRLIAHIFLYLGLRIEEVSGLDVDDIFLDHGDISTIFIKGKGGTGSTMVIKKEILPIFENYLKLRKAKLKEKKKSAKKMKALLITGQGSVRRLSINQIRWLIKNRGREIGFKKKITPHWFRVTAISHLSEKVGIRSAFNFARHQDIKSTEGYDRRRIDIANHPAQFIDYANSTS